MDRNKYAILISTLLVSSAVVPFAIAQKGKHPVTVTIVRVAQVDNLDKFDVKPDRADFYCTIWIDGKRYRTPNMSKDDARPNWIYTVPTTKRNVPIRIKLADDDGGMEQRDDQGDINPKGNKKELDLMFDTKTGKITGDVSGMTGKVIYVRGGGDNDKCKIWFKIQ